jgi:hypothetical protein
MGVDYWQQYRVGFDHAAGEVTVQFGPVVNTGQVPVPGTGSADAREARAQVAVPFRNTYEGITTVDIFDGPSFAMEPERDGRVNVYFLPWHRTWSHSLLTGLFLGAGVAVLFGWRAGLVVPLAFGAHILEDQYGHMGSNLFWPLTRKRFAGAGRMHATDAVPNFLTVWTCCLLIFWNLFRYVEDPIRDFNLIQLLFFGGLLPLGLFALIHRWAARKRPSAAEPADGADEWIEPMAS